ncbi:hypothetical protein COS93_01195 [bacterium (Candidatus Gribaldobacteria) CG07_land_8_20_14_0_80_33_18]|uniref:Uncharacterized protein n=1 Tax=bacterium (Candidatus Gribaldobacteria) CG07_land_8_20_14_0_80_33_18 TaxID=2014272 RepID=A0A2M6Z3J3_9BACT|nr:MAG: hypothetical protein COS93_01195 [bacterium (Candidatus Gribaldobacteria) CG07_land_8_20_14_0_80_33_18]
MKKILILILVLGVSWTYGFAGEMEKSITKSEKGVVNTQRSLLTTNLKLINTQIQIKETTKGTIEQEISKLEVKKSKDKIGQLKKRLESLQAEYEAVKVELRELRNREAEYLRQLNKLEEEEQAQKTKDWLEETGSGFGLGLGVVDGKFVCDIRGKIEKLVIYYEIDGQKDEKTTSYWIGATYPIWKFLNVSFLVGLQTGNFQNYNPTVGIAYHAGKFFLEGRYGFQIGLHPESWGVAGGIYF